MIVSKSGLGFNPLDWLVVGAAQVLNAVAPGAGVAVGVAYAGVKEATKGGTVNASNKSIKDMWIRLQADPSWWAKSESERTSVYWSNTLEEMKSEPAKVKTFFSSKIGINLDGNEPSHVVMYAIAQAASSVAMILTPGKVFKIYEDRAYRLAESVYGKGVNVFQCLEGGITGKAMKESDFIKAVQPTVACLESRRAVYAPSATSAPPDDAYVTGYEGQKFQKAPWYRWKYLPHVVGIGVIGLVGYKLLK